MIDFMKKNTKLTVVIVIVAIVLAGFRISSNMKAEKEKEDEKLKVRQELMEQANSGTDEGDSILMQMQSDLEKSYGKVPEGFIWETDGTVLSLGDKSMSSEDVVYSYFRGLSALDMSTVERYSRNSLVVESYSGYFDETNKNTDYLDQFIRNMYKQCLLSIQIEGIEDQAVFAENKQVFTVNAKMLDLTDKDFWEKDRDEIFNKLYLYDSDESDTAKGDMYLFDYILGYYESGKAGLRDVNFNVTVQRYPDLDSGWLVSIDTDVDDACQYKDGKLVVNYIKEVYRDEGLDKILKEKSKE